MLADLPEKDGWRKFSKEIGKDKESRNFRKEEQILQAKIWVGTIYFPFPLEFYKLYLAVKAKIIISDVVLKVGRGNINYKW